MATPLEQFIFRGEPAGFARQQRLQQSPIIQRQQELGLEKQEQEANIARGKLLLNSIDAIQSASTDPKERFELTRQAVPELQQFGLDIDLSDATLDDFSDEGLQRRRAVVAGHLPKKDEDITAFQSRMNFLQEQLQGAVDPDTNRLFERGQLTPMQEAAAVELGILPRASISAQERLGLDPQLSADVARSQAEIAGAKAGATEEFKLSVQRDIKPEIEAAIVEARKTAESSGESFTDLKRSQAALPGLREVVNQLRELTPFATATTSGRVFDTLVKEFGFGATEGATARAKYIAIIDNQLLPLLRQTFGSAFTEGEGERLKATLGDPNASAEEKNAQLDAFIDAKVREIETKEREVQQFSDQKPAQTESADFGAAGDVAEGTVAVNPNTGQTIIVSNGRWVAQ